VIVGPLAKGGSSDRADVFTGAIPGVSGWTEVPVVMSAGGVLGHVPVSLAIILLTCGLLSVAVIATQRVDRPPNASRAQASSGPSREAVDAMRARIRPQSSGTRRETEIIQP
jgi:hypothetical protein